MSLTEFLAKVLHDKNFGSYVTRDRLGSIWDCTTAPEFSQIFGESIELLVLNAHQQREIDRPHCLMNLVQAEER